MQIYSRSQVYETGMKIDFLHDHWSACVGSRDVTGRVVETQIEPEITAMDSNLGDLQSSEVDV